MIQLSHLTHTEGYFQPREKQLVHTALQNPNPRNSAAKLVVLLWKWAWTTACITPALYAEKNPTDKQTKMGMFFYPEGKQTARTGQRRVALKGQRDI